MELTDVGDQENLHLEYGHTVAKAASWAGQEGQDAAPSTRQEVGASDVLLLEPTLRSESLTVAPNRFEAVDCNSRDVDDLASLDRNLVNEPSICANDGLRER
jgi:hypothetical protein